MPSGCPACIGQNLPETIRTCLLQPTPATATSRRLTCASTCPCWPEMKLPP